MTLVRVSLYVTRFLTAVNIRDENRLNYCKDKIPIVRTRWNLNASHNLVFVSISFRPPIQVAELSRTQVYGRSIAGIAVRIPLKSWILVSYVCCVVSGLCDRPITRPGEYDRVWVCRYMCSSAAVAVNTYDRLGVRGWIQILNSSCCRHLSSNFVYENFEKHNSIVEEVQIAGCEIGRDVSVVAPNF